LFATEPPIAPRLRTCTSPRLPAIRASAGIAKATCSLVSTSTWRAIAPMTTLSPSRLIPRSSAMPERSTSAVGRARRCFSAGSKVWPPESGRASGSAERIFTASATLDGLW
jgi:hypothetical protein